MVLSWNSWVYNLKENLHWQNLFLVILNNTKTTARFHPFDCL